MTLSNPVALVEDIEGVIPIERYDGAPVKAPSGKAITWSISNINEDYEDLDKEGIQQCAQQ